MIYEHKSGAKRRDKRALPSNSESRVYSYYSNMWAEQVSFSVSFKSAMICPRSGHVLNLPGPCTAFSQSLSVNSFRWRIRGERAGNALTFSHGPRDPKRFGREEKWGLGTRQVLNENPFNHRTLIFTNICKTVYVLHTLQEKQRELKELCRKLEEAEKSLKETEDKFV